MECCLGYYSASYDETEKWEYDVALDSIRQVKPADRKVLYDNPHISDYYFGLAMWIRNTYIHPVKKFNPCDADNVSVNIMYKIFSIVNPVYDYRNEQLVSYYNDNEMSKLGKMYRKCQPAVFDEIENELVLGKYASSNTAVHELKCKLREVLGLDEFVRLFKEAWDDFRYEKHVNHFGVANISLDTILFEIQENQLKALDQTMLLDSVYNYEVLSENECRKYIDEKFGLKEEYADFMAKCIWEVCNPAVNHRDKCWSD